MNEKNTFQLILKAAGSSTDLARALGVSPQAVSHWKKSGKIPKRHVVKLSQLLHIPPQEILPSLTPLQLDHLQRDNT